MAIDIGGSWIKGYPVRSLYHFELVVHLCRPQKKGGLGFHLAQEIYWYNPAKLPTPAEWVTVRRERVKDAINTIWWLSKDPHPIANNRKVLKPYSNAMKNLLKNGYKAKNRPSGHNISKKFQKDRGGAIPPNIIQTTQDNEIGEAVPVNVISAYLIHLLMIIIKKDVKRKELNVILLDFLKHYQSFLLIFVLNQEI